MTTVVKYTPHALADLVRLEEAAPGGCDLIASAIGALENHPLIGRPDEEGLRELIISRGRTGYVALYRYDEQADAAIIAAIRHMREAGHDES